MEIKGKIHCMFKQSGTFKGEFIKLGYEAYDYDIQNNFGETDYVIDLFGEIHKAWDNIYTDQEHVHTIFDDISKDDFIIAFFPCIKFCNMAEYNQRSFREVLERNGKPLKDIYTFLKKQSDERYYFYQTALKFTAVVEMMGVRMVVENPWHEANYTNNFWFNKPKYKDMDRTRRGDYLKKPTAFWFINCDPEYGFTYQQTPSNKVKACGAGVRNRKKLRDQGREYTHDSKVSGLCSEESSMISKDYARNFICDQILGVNQNNISTQQTLW